MKNQVRSITRNRYLTPEEAARYAKIREQIAKELPDLIARHHKRMAARRLQRFLYIIALLIVAALVIGFFISAKIELPLWLLAG